MKDQFGETERIAAQLRTRSRFVDLRVRQSALQRGRWATCYS